MVFRTEKSMGGGLPRSCGIARLSGCAVARMRGCLGESIVLWCIDYNENYVYTGINAASQEAFSTCNNYFVCCMVMYVYIAGINAASQEVFSMTRGVIINPAIKCYCVLF